MPKMTSYRILATGVMLGLGLMLSAALARAQVVKTAPSDFDMYCSGVHTDQRVPSETYVISGEDSPYRITFHPGDYVYLNRGGSQGVKVGDELEVIRPETEPTNALWFKYQVSLNHAMGTRYADIGRLRVVHVDEKISIAENSLACLPIQRGDLALPFVARQAPQFHAAAFDPFAAPSGKKTAMVVKTKEFAVLAGAGDFIYVNLGTTQGVKVGDYFRVFRYHGANVESAYQFEKAAYDMYGFGRTPVAYSWNNLPRQILGEGIVLRVGPNSSTVLLTASRQGIFIGDYVEVE